MANDWGDVSYLVLKKKGDLAIFKELGEFDESCRGAIYALGDPLTSDHPFALLNASLLYTALVNLRPKHVIQFEPNFGSIYPIAKGKSLDLWRIKKKKDLYKVEFSFEESKGIGVKAIEFCQKYPGWRYIWHYDMGEEVQQFP